MLHECKITFRSHEKGRRPRLLLHGLLHSHLREDEVQGAVQAVRAALPHVRCNLQQMCCLLLLRRRALKSICVSVSVRWAAPWSGFRCKAVCLCWTDSTSAPCGRTWQCSGPPCMPPALLPPLPRTRGGRARRRVKSVRSSNHNHHLGS